MKRGKPAKKYSQASRIHDIIRLIEARHGMTIDELAEETGVTRRTIHRDLNSIHESGYPLVSDRLHGVNVYRFLTKFRDVPPISFTLQELATLYFLRSQAELFQGTPFIEELDAIFGKVRSVLPPRYAAHLERISGVAMPLFQGRHDYSASSEIIRQVRDCLIHQKGILLRYLPSGRENAEDYRVDPYTLAFYKGGLYLIGFVHNRGDLRTFAVDRMLGVTVGDEQFELPADYRPEERLKDSFGIVAEGAMAVKIRFSPVVAPSVRGRIWHSSQSIEECGDGSLILTFVAGGRFEILSWLLSYGEHAELLMPELLRNELAKIVCSMAALYGGRQ